MTVPEEAPLELRVATLESEVARLDRIAGHALEDSAAARLLAAGADLDVATLSVAFAGHVGTINAIRDDQRDMRADVQGLRDDVEGLRSEMQGGFAMVASGFEALHDRLDRWDDAS